MKNERFYYNRIFNCFKRSICIFSCFILCICFIPYTLVYAIPTDALDVGHVSSNSGGVVVSSNGYRYGAGGSGSNPMYCFRSSQSGGNTLLTFITVEDTNLWGYQGTYLAQNLGLNYDSSTGYRYIRLSNSQSGTINSNVPETIYEGTSISEIIQSFIDDTGSSSDYPLLYDYDIPNGNVAYIQAANEGDTIYVSATFPQQSTLFSNSWSPMTMKYNWAPISSGGAQSIHTSFPYNGQLDLPLVKSGDTNLLGQSKTGTCTFTQVASNSLEIYNPSYRQVNASNQDQYLLNPSIHIHCDTGFIKLSVYPLKESLTPGGITATADPENVMILQHTENSTPEDPESEWVGADTTSSTNPPVPGGDNELPETFTIGDYINKLHDTLSNFAKSVISLLEQPIEHIGDLIQAGTGFMSSLRGIYAWLPVDIQGLVISALTVVIGIGVFKVFL